MTKTQNYQLNQWESTDPIRRADFNADNAAIDAALAAQAAAINGKAEQSAVDTALAEKADQSALDTLTAALGTGGDNCRIATGRYTGTGTYGTGGLTTLTFEFRPLLVAIFHGNDHCVFGRSCTTGRGMDGGAIFVSWSSTSINLKGSTASDQCNKDGSTYYWVALGN